MADTDSLEAVSHFVGRSPAQLFEKVPRANGFAIRIQFYRLAKRRGSLLAMSVLQEHATEISDNASQLSGCTATNK